ncbi:MAG: ABC transporter substrate-binding protein [Firmicutes bacterium]|nr:ABC transporter substrate-binding protein [Bacillota bacterium]
MHRITKICTRAGAILLAAGLCFCTIAMAGCGKKDDGSGKIINFPVEEAPRRLDPVIAGTPSELMVVNNCMEGLVRQDAEGNLAPGVAETWEVSPDGRTLTFHLRGDNRWRLPDKAKELLGEAAFAAFDTQVTAGDFVFGLERARGLRGEYENILRVRAADRRTLEITLEKPGAAFLYALARGPAMPCNRTYFEACGGRYGLEAQYMPCNGPFYLDRMGDTLTRLKPNESCRDAASPGNRALPATVNLWTEPDAYMRARLVGTEYDAAIVPADLDAPLPEGVTGSELKNATLALVFNCGAGPLADVNIRVALCAALEPETLGIGAPPGLLPEGVLAGGANYRTAAGQPGGVKYDPARANALAGGAGETIHLTLICAGEYETLLRCALQSWQKAFRLRLEAQIEPLEPEELQERLEDGEFDAAVALLHVERSAAPEALRALEGEGSPARYRSPALETLLDAAAQTDDTARACLQAEEHLLQNGVFYPLRAMPGRLLLAPGVEGLEVSPVGDRLFFGGVRKWD